MGPIVAFLLLFGLPLAIVVRKVAQAARAANRATGTRLVGAATRAGATGRQEAGAPSASGVRVGEVLAAVQRGSTGAASTGAQPPPLPRAALEPVPVPVPSEPATDTASNAASVEQKFERFFARVAAARTAEPAPPQPALDLAPSPPEAPTNAPGSEAGARVARGERASRAATRESARPASSAPTGELAALLERAVASALDGAPGPELAISSSLVRPLAALYSAVARASASDTGAARRALAEVAARSRFFGLALADEAELDAARLAAACSAVRRAAPALRAFVAEDLGRLDAALAPAARGDVALLRRLLDAE